MSTRAAELLESTRYDRDSPRRIQRILGMVGVCALVAVLAISAALFLIPFGKRTYNAVLTEAGSVTVGADVRIAGISVGKVTALELGRNEVRMKFAVKNDVHLGESTRLQIRLLTAIGGHYVAVLPSGSKDLGSFQIPADRVQLPYSLIQAMQDSHRPVSQVQGDALRRSLADLTSALKKSPGDVDSLATGMAAMTDTLDRQSRAVGEALAVAEEYLRTVTESRSSIGAMISKVGMMEDQLLGRRGELTEALRVTSEVLWRIAAVEPAYREYEGPIIKKLAALATVLRDLETRVGAMASSLDDAGKRLAALAGPGGPVIDQSKSVAQVLSTCVPLPGKAC